MKPLRTRAGAVSCMPKTSARRASACSSPLFDPFDKAQRKTREPASIVHVAIMSQGAERTEHRTGIPQRRGLAGPALSPAAGPRRSHRGHWFIESSGMAITPPSVRRAVVCGPRRQQGA